MWMCFCVLINALKYTVNFLCVFPSVQQSQCDWRLGGASSAAARARCLSCHVGGVDWVILWESKVPFTAARGVIHRAPLGSAQGGHHTLSPQSRLTYEPQGRAEERWQCGVEILHPAVCFLCDSYSLLAFWLTICKSIQLNYFFRI